MRTLLPALVLAWALLLGAPAVAGSDPVKELTDRDVQVRLAAVEILAGGDVEGAEAALLKALTDRDWEVRERAAVALGSVGTEESVKPLVDVAVTGPIRRVRRAAAVSAGALDQRLSVELLAKMAGRKKTAESAYEALGMFTNKLRSGDARKVIAKGLKNKEPMVRAAAARNLGAFGGDEATALLSRLLGDENLEVVATGLETVIAYPAEEHLPVLLAGLGKKDLKNVVERRIMAAIRSIIATAGGNSDAVDLADPVLSATAKTGQGFAQVRLARLIGIVAEKLPADKPGDDPPPPLLSATAALGALDRSLEHTDADVRAAAVHALGLIGTGDAVERAAGVAKSDLDARVRLHALRAVLHNHDVLDQATFSLAVDRLGDETDLLVREEAAVALGKAKVEGAVPALERALLECIESPETKWALGTVAAVSIGKTQDPAGVQVLIDALAASKDWRLKASAVVGLGHIAQPIAVPHLIGGLKAKHPVLRNCAYEAMRRLAGKDLEPKTKVWLEWWDSVKDGFVFEDREELARKAQKFGYAPTNVGVYEGLDVIVLQSNGDHIEQLLDKLEIEHRITRCAQVASAGLHPWGLFVANCSGEITEKDAAQLQWFVRAGGYLFCSCWALRETMERVYPGLEGYDPPIRKLPTTGTVLENVIARRCPSRSPYLEDVFDGVTRPIYVLYGAHLIEVIDHEKVEVLIDSPDCASTWGGGNLAAWFTAGHGVILDSANHFDLQGLEKASGVGKPDELMAYAIDHMGLGYEELREYRERGLWKNKSKAHKAARDLSAFRFITNFVRAKRRRDL